MEDLLFHDFLDNGIISLFLNELNTKEWTNSLNIWYSAKLKCRTKLIGYGRMKICNNIDDYLWNATYTKKRKINDTLEVEYKDNTMKTYKFQSFENHKHKKKI